MDAKEFNRRFKNASKDKQSFLKIYEEYYSKIVLHISVKFDDSIAHDIAHDFFCKLIEGKFEQVGSVASPTAWIYKVCDNLAINSFKKDARYVSIDDFDFAGNESAIDGLLEVKELFENLNETEKRWFICTFLKAIRSKNSLVNSKSNMTISENRMRQRSKNSKR